MQFFPISFLFIKMNLHFCMINPVPFKNHIFKNGSNGFETFPVLRNATASGSLLPG